MREARRHEHEVAGFRPQRAVAGPDLELALDDVEELLDLAMDVTPVLNPGEAVNSRKVGPPAGRCPSALYATCEPRNESALP